MQGYYYSARNSHWTSTQMPALRLFEQAQTQTVLLHYPYELLTTTALGKHCLITCYLSPNVCLLADHIIP
jgi:hypothetical protein